MGNQLTGVAPSQILPVEQYLSDVTNFHFESNLGSTRFFKVAKAQSKEGSVVVKVFVIHDPSLPLRTYKERLEEIQSQLQDGCNVLPFHKSIQSERAALVFRQYVKYSLYDRISTRPFLNPIEKKWLVFQLLSAVSKCHRMNVCHGDIKSENVMVTSWNWVLLADFASFKPTYLPEDNPADFSYFFDTSRRRTCYLAPERFVESTWRTTTVAVAGGGELKHEASNLDLTAGEVKTGDLTPAMDIFSTGCVLAELFTEGRSPFDLSELLAYRAGEYSPVRVIQKIDDIHIRDLITSMIQREPSERKSAEQYLQEQRGKAFPDYFYTVLFPYCPRFAATPIMTPDERIERISRDLDRILQQLKVTSSTASGNSDSAALVVIISLVTSAVRQLQYCFSRLTALAVMLKLSQHVTSEVVLDRILPYMLHLVTDSFPAVRCSAIRTITTCLEGVKSVPPPDTNIFPEYILPAMSHLTQDTVTMVRVTYAENIARLAETALRFLEMTQFNQNNSTECSMDLAQTHDFTAQYKQTSYDTELLALHEMIQTKVAALLSDPDNIVKQTLVQSGITSLCVFFGRQKANDVLLSHMITFLNDKTDWQLRASFYDNIVGVAAYVGWACSAILQPLLEQGLTDAEEFVIARTLTAMSSIVELGLIQKSFLRELIKQSLHFLVHPNVWICQAAVGFIARVGRSMDVADVHCHLLCKLEPFLRNPIIQVDQELVLLSNLKSPLSRQLFDHLIKSAALEPLIDHLTARQLVRSISRHDHEAIYPPAPDDSVATLFRKLTSQGLAVSEEEKVISMSDFLLKLHRSRATYLESCSSSSGGAGGGGSGGVGSGRGVAVGGDDNSGGAGWGIKPLPGDVNLSLLGPSNLCRQVDLKTVWGGTGDTVGGGAVTRAEGGGGGVGGVRRPPATVVAVGGIKKRPGGASSAGSDIPAPPNMNEEWKQMFGGASDEKTAGGLAGASALLPVDKLSTSTIAAVMKDKNSVSSVDSLTPLGGGANGRQPLSDTSSDQMTASQSSTSSAVMLTNSAVPLGSVGGAGGVGQGGIRREGGVGGQKVRLAICKIHLRELTQRKVERYRQDCLMMELMDNASSDLPSHTHGGGGPSPPAPGVGGGTWKPQGLLIAHLHEHRGSVNRVRVSSDQTYFVTCSNDGTVKLWDCSRLEGKSVTNRSKHTYNKQGGQIKTVCFCETSQSVAAASDAGAIHVFRVESSSPRINILHTRNLDVTSEGLVVDMTHFDTGTENVISYATVHGLIVGWDLRAPRIAWRLQNDPRHGLITSFDVQRQLCWLAVGTSSGVHVAWDMRFQLPINTIEHPTRTRVRRLLVDNSTQSQIISSVQGNNEVSVWNVETGSRQRTLWASSAPPLSQTQASPHCVNGMCVGARSSYLLTAGTDMRVRYWDLSYPVNSQIVIAAANDPPNKEIVAYRSRILEGSEVVQEVYGKPRVVSGGGAGKGGGVEGGVGEESYGPERPAVGHHDIITDIATCHTATQILVITSSRDGMVKVWK